MGERLKSSWELAMERLGMADEEGGLSDGQKEAIAEVRNRTRAKLAEREILHQAELARLAGTPEGMVNAEKLKQELVDERKRMERERDEKIHKIRSQSESS